MQTDTRPALTEFHAFEAGLKTLTGADYHDDADPGMILNKVTSDDTTVYVWWPVGGYDTPCLAWQSPRGWSAVVVDNDADGWFGEMWYGKIHDLSRALLFAPEPTTLLSLLAAACDEATNNEFPKHWQHKQKALAWGLRLLTEGEDRAAADKVADDYACNIEAKGTINWYTSDDDVAYNEDLRRIDLLAARNG